MDRTSDATRTVKCANCAIPLEGEPVEKDGRPFCCDGCADGGPCLC